MKPHILIVDDETFMLRLIEASLNKGGFDISAYRSGEAAIAAAAQEPPHLIILDLMMPGLDGLATLRRLKEIESLRNTPVIMLTAKGHHLAQVEATESGANVFLTKPFSPSQLLAETRRLLAASIASV
jgi:two-component system alkaline phosphatase synthesis response regulator PhoP